MRVALDATTLGSGAGGDETLVLSMLRGLATVTGGADSVLVLTSPGAELPAAVTKHPCFTVDRAPRHSGPRHYLATLPRWLDTLVTRGRRPDVVVSLTHAPVRAPAPVALTVTDLSFLHVPDAYPRSTRLRLRALVGRQSRSAAAVLTISGFCRDDLVTSYGLPPEKVHVVGLTIDPPGVAEDSARAALAARGVHGPFLLYLGNLHPRKNVPLAIRAFLDLQAADPRLAGHQFVVAGRTWFGSLAEREAAADAQPGAVVFLDRVSDAEREVLLSDAAALVYLSTFEGFGLPPLEAMARGTVVLASDRTAVPEVCGDGALLVDPTDPDQVRMGLLRILTDDPLRARLARRGRERAAGFHIRRSGTELLAALTATCAPPGGQSTERPHPRPAVSTS